MIAPVDVNAPAASRAIARPRRSQRRARHSRRDESRPHAPAALGQQRNVCERDAVADKNRVVAR